MVSRVLGARVGAALVVGAVGFGAAGAAAYAGVLPSGLQRFAHDTIGAPAPRPVHSADKDKTSVEKDKSRGNTTTQTGKTAVGPDVAGSAAYGLCTAWSNVEPKGQVAEKSVAFRNVATAAGGADKVTGYCAAVVHPGVIKPEKAAPRPTGKPSTQPALKPSTQPAGRPSTQPAGRPSTQPAGKPSPMPSHTPAGAGANHKP